MTGSLTQDGNFTLKLAPLPLEKPPKGVVVGLINLQKLREDLSKRHL